MKNAHEGYGDIASLCGAAAGLFGLLLLHFGAGLGLGAVLACAIAMAMSWMLRARREMEDARRLQPIRVRTASSLRERRR